MTNAAYKLILIVLAAVPAFARPNGQPKEKIHVCVVADDEIPTIPLLRAEAISARMFATAGVAIGWRSGKIAECDAAVQYGTLKLRLVARASADLHPGAMAYAQLHQGSEIVVMFDRIPRSTYGMNQSVQVSNILAHVMTHEITHLLQGIARHSETGVMKAHWAPGDFAEMAFRPLPFAPEDVELIRLGILTSLRQETRL